jgi:hypothetical protein
MLRPGRPGYCSVAHVRYQNFLSLKIFFRGLSPLRLLHSLCIFILVCSDSDHSGTSRLHVVRRDLMLRTCTSMYNFLLLTLAHVHTRSFFIFYMFLSVFSSFFLSFIFCFYFFIPLFHFYFYYFYFYISSRVVFLEYFLFRLFFWIFSVYLFFYIFHIRVFLSFYIRIYFSIIMICLVNKISLPFFVVMICFGVLKFCSSCSLDLFHGVLNFSSFSLLGSLFFMYSFLFPFFVVPFFSPNLFDGLNSRSSCSLFFCSDLFRGS